MHGSGPLFESLHEEACQRQVTDLCAIAEWQESGLSVHHCFRLFPEGDTGETRDGPAAEFFDLLERERPIARDTLQQCLQHSHPAHDGAVERMRGWIPELNLDAVIGRARRLGTEWWADHPEEETTS